MFLSFLVPVTFAVSLKQALNQAAGHFKSSGKIYKNNQIVISGITNYHSHKKDQLAKRIETEMYFAFGNQFDDVKLIDSSEAIAGVSSKNTIFIKGTYKQTGETAVLHLIAIKNILTGEVFDQSNTAASR